jgi:myo-inositol-1-phosphate synthase
VKTRETPKRAVARLRRDIADFKTSERLDRVVVVNLASTEPPPDGEPPRDANALARALTSGRGLRASTLYAVAALEEGCPWINFTPSVSAMNDGIVDRACAHGVPVAGSDGKTGETLVKSALAPMFAHRRSGCSHGRARTSSATATASCCRIRPTRRRNSSRRTRC